LFDTFYHAVALHPPDALLVTSDVRYYDKAQNTGRVILLENFSLGSLELFLTKIAVVSFWRVPHNPRCRLDPWESVVSDHRRRRNTRNRSGIKNHWHRQIWRAQAKPATEGAHNASCNLSGIEDRWGAARIRAAPFLFLESDHDDS